MKLFKLYVCCAVLLFTNTLTFAQQKFSGDVTLFPNEVTAMMLNTNNLTANEAGAKLSSTWGQFSPNQQKEMVALSQKMVKSKKFRTIPHFVDFYSGVTALKTNNPSQVDSMMIVINYMLDKNMDAKSIELALHTIRLVALENMIYSATYNDLRFKKGSFSIGLKVAAQPFEIIEETPKEDTISQTTDNAFQDWDNWEQNEETWGTTEESVTEDALGFGFTPPLQPTVQGPVITFTNADFLFETPNDTALLQNTNGSLMLGTGLYVGKGGKMDWSSAGNSDIYCDLAEYNFNVKSYRFVSEGSYLHYPEQTDSIPMGVFEFNSVKYKSKAAKNYPRFKSFNSNIPVKGLDKNIVYHGGFSLSGQTIYSSSLDEGYSTIEVIKDGIPVIKAISNRFQLGDTIISADYCKTTIMMKEDSISHPATVFKYNKSKQFLKLTKTDGFRLTPFMDSYHRIQIVADACIWDMNTSKIQFNIVNGRSVIPAKFESLEIFKMDDYSQMKGMYPFHPLQLAVGYADKIHSDEFPVAELADAYKLPLNTVKGAMSHMMKLGYLDYNPKSGLVYINKRTRHQVASRRDKSDYDNIKFASLTSTGANAELDLDSNKLIVHGVKRLYLSDSLNVNIEPDSNTVEILKNRDFNFNGKINTANYQFVGTNFKFNYDSFYVKMGNIDQIRLSAAVTDTTANKNSKGNKGAKVLGNELRYSSGTLYINEPKNKSSRKKIPKYPIFDATTGASVFFNKPDIAGGAYDTSLKFKIPPFLVDSLSSDDPQSVGFDGTFESGGIFPPFKEKLVVMPDYSLGFKHKSPKDGFTMYEGDARFEGEVKMDNQGLRSKGEIHYLNATLYSFDFVHFKDSTLTEGYRFENKAGAHPKASPDATFPNVQIEKYRMKWMPKTDTMLLSNVDKPFLMYDTTAQLQGTLNLMHTGMYGMGIFDTRGSLTETKDFHFQQNEVNARNSIFRVKSDNVNKPALKATDVKVDFKLIEGLASFGPEKEGFASTEFPYAMYKTSLDKGLWDLKKKEIYLKAKDSSHIEKAYFYSTHPEQDSLWFNASSATYKIDSLYIDIHGVPFIRVNDGRIFPEHNSIIVKENAVIPTLNNAELRLDTINNYHYLYDGNIDILGRKKFNGEAIYQFINLANDTLPIKFSNFIYQESEKKKEGAYTIGIAQINDTDSLYVGDNILYKGKITMNSRNKYLAFDGYVKLDLRGALKNSSWLKYDNTGESGRVTLDLATAVTQDGKPLVTGLFVTKSSNELYTSFISEKMKEVDIQILKAGTGFSFNSELAEFIVGDPSWIDSSTIQGNYLSYNDNKSTIKYGGQFQFIAPIENIPFISGGYGSANVLDTTYIFNTASSIAFKGLEGVFKLMGPRINETTKRVEEDPSFEEKQAEQTEKENRLVQIIGDDNLKKYNEKNLSGDLPLFNSDAAFTKAMLFSKLDLKWSPTYHSFYSKSNVVLSSILKTNINDEMKAYVEIRKTGKGDNITIYLMPSNSTWYYIHYDENRLSFLSSEVLVNKGLKSKGELPDRTKYYAVLAEQMEVNKFLSLFKERYNVVDEESDEEVIEMNNDSLNVQDSTNTLDSLNFQPKKQMQLEDTDNSEQRLKDQEGKNNYQDSNTNSDQYKLNEQDTNYESQEAEEQKKKPTVEDQQKSYQQQQQLKDLFK
jgi:hypothetical protein